MNEELREKIDKRQEANLAIVAELLSYVEKFPELRFGQLLFVLDVNQFERPLPLAGPPASRDIFNDESVDILERIRKQRERIG